MKNLLFIITALAIAGSSCSSKIGIAKRKYGKGYYVSVSHSPKQVNSKSKLTSPPVYQDKEEVKQVKVSSQVKSDENHGALVSANSIALAPQPEAKKSVVNKQENPLQANALPASGVTSKNKLKRLDSVLLSANSKADDTNTILLVILCLFWFLNLIAVYLKQGKKITKDFWITLILDITFILGVIYSILVVLDVLSFA